MKSNLLKGFLFLTLISFISCRKDTNTASCSIVACQNGGELINSNTIDCHCNCPSGFTGDRCQVALTPTAIIVDTIWVTGFKMADNNGLAWDAASIGIDRNPDIYIVFTDTKNTTTYLKSSVITNADNTQKYWYKLNTPITLSDITKSYSIELWDKDLGTSIDPDDYIGGVQGLVYTSSYPVFPQRFKSSCSTCSVNFELSVRYKFD